jgi:hypothetical protein
MDRKPEPAPFPVGTKVRYVGTRRTEIQASTGEMVPVIAPGMIATVERVNPGRQGTLRPLPGEWEDEGNPVLDTTRNGYSVYSVPLPGGKSYGRIIWPSDAAEWERV